MCARRGYSQFLFGSAPGIADKAAATLMSAYPELRITGTLQGFVDADRGYPARYDEAEQDRMVERINAADPDVVWVCIPTPLQQDWVLRNGPRITAPVIITGGSYIDHLSERIQWYPAWVLRLRVGWLYRLYREPQRLWRRYTIELLEYWLIVVRHRLLRRPAGNEAGSGPPTT